MERYELTIPTLISLGKKSKPNFYDRLTSRHKAAVRELAYMTWNDMRDTNTYRTLNDKILAALGAFVLWANATSAVKKNQIKQAAAKMGLWLVVSKMKKYAKAMMTFAPYPSSTAIPPPPKAWQMWQYPHDAMVDDGEYEEMPYQYKPSVTMAYRARVGAEFPVKQSKINTHPMGAIAQEAFTTFVQYIAKYTGLHTDSSIVSSLASKFAAQWPEELDNVTKDTPPGKIDKLIQLEKNSLEEMLVNMNIEAKAAAAGVEIIANEIRRAVNQKLASSATSLRVQSNAAPVTQASSEQVSHDLLQDNTMHGQAISDQIGSEGSANGLRGSTEEGAPPAAESTAVAETEVGDSDQSNEQQDNLPIGAKPAAEPQQPAATFRSDIQSEVMDDPLATQFADDKALRTKIGEQYDVMKNVPTTFYPSLVCTQNKDGGFTLFFIPISPPYAPPNLSQQSVIQRICPPPEGSPEPEEQAISFLFRSGKSGYIHPMGAAFATFLRLTGKTRPSVEEVVKYLNILETTDRAELLRYLLALSFVEGNGKGDVSQTMSTPEINAIIDNTKDWILLAPADGAVKLQIIPVPPVSPYKTSPWVARGVGRLPNWSRGIASSYEGHGSISGGSDLSSATRLREETPAVVNTHLGFNRFMGMSPLAPAYKGVRFYGYR